jgi:hypothetical protein
MSQDVRVLRHVNLRQTCDITCDIVDQDLY